MSAENTSETIEDSNRSVEDYSWLESRIDGLEARLGSRQISSENKFTKFDSLAQGYDLNNIIILVRASILSYRDQDKVGSVLSREGIDTFHWFEDPITDSQAFCFPLIQGGQKALIVAFRGTSGARDIAIDIKRHRLPITIGGEDCGRAHEGFVLQLENVWPELVSTIHEKYQGHKIWFTGHSLGGALATLAAFLYYKTENSADNIGGLCTIGQPRVLSVGPHHREFQRALGDDRIFRIYRAIDPVPLVPYFGYKHVSGRRCYIKSNGKFVYNLSAWYRRLDQFIKLGRTFRTALLQGRVKKLRNLVTDHASQGYLDDLVYTNTLAPPTPWSKKISNLIKAVNIIRIDSPPVDFSKPVSASLEGDAGSQVSAS